MKFFNQINKKYLLIFFAALITTAKITGRVIFFYNNTSAQEKDVEVEQIHEKETTPSLTNFENNPITQKNENISKKNIFESIINNSSQLLNIILRFDEFTKNTKNRLEKEDLFISGLINLAFLQDFESELIEHLGQTKGINFISKRIDNLRKTAEQTLSGLMPSHEINKIAKQYITESGRASLAPAEKIIVLRSFLKYIKGELSFQGSSNNNQKGNYIDGLNQLETLLRHELPPMLSISEQLQKDVLKLIKIAHQQGEKLYSHNNYYRYEKKLSEIINLVLNLKTTDQFIFEDENQRTALYNLTLKLEAFFQERTNSNFPEENFPRKTIENAPAKDKKKVEQPRQLKLISVKTNSNTSFRNTEKKPVSTLKVHQKNKPQATTKKNTNKKNLQRKLPKEKKTKPPKKPKKRKTTKDDSN